MKETKPLVYEGMRTPWGKADIVKLLTDGIGEVMTPGHGGFKLSPERNKHVPQYMRRKGGWYEEDCEWAIPVCVFEEELLKTEHAKRLIADNVHRDTLRNWFPDEYEKFYSVKLEPGQSFIRDEQLFHQENADKLVVISACGDWHKTVPAGMVGVVATLGESREPGVEHHQFLVPKEEYDKRGRFGFVIEDPSKYRVWVDGVV